MNRQKVAMPDEAPGDEWMNIGAEVARRFADLGADDFPAPVRDTVGRFLLDTFGVIAGAARAPGIAEMNRATAGFEPEGRTTVLLDEAGRGPSIAAMLNGAAAHALDFDDQHDPARIHAFCVVLPAALAASEAKGGVDGRSFVTAVACGVELFCRLGLACYNSLGKGWHPTTALGSIAAALTAGRIFGLDGERMAHAMGLAFTQMSGTTQFIADGALAKRMGPGFAARNGVLAARLAETGVTGPTRFLEGKAGLFALYERGEVTPDILRERIGSRWHLLDVSMKPYPCCRCVHSTIQLGLELYEEGIRPDDIASATITLGAVNADIVGAPFVPDHANPVVHAQFNACYGLAAALTDGRVGLATYTAERVRAPESALASRFEVVVPGTIEATAIAPAAIEIVLKDGRTVSKSTQTMKGAPDQPMSPEEISDKFADCLAWGFGADRATSDRLAETILAIEGADDIRDVVAAFRAARADG
ncbi:MmgE/PrpD family protein [Afifella sp. IM 167]|uniref:MmgE/PrpD family protein n=1 Tax=Afifella sp. IM 167 TaxID=2033586 RepID=UPI001CCA0FCA|nr:MmgE/PrpD family protein [Afifella sp. IM 167]